VPAGLVRLPAAPYQTRSAPPPVYAHGARRVHVRVAAVLLPGSFGGQRGGGLAGAQQVCRFSALYGLFESGGQERRIQADQAGRDESRRHLRSKQGAHQVRGPLNPDHVGARPAASRQPPHSARSTSASAARPARSWHARTRTPGASSATPSPSAPPAQPTATVCPATARGRRCGCREAGELIQAGPCVTPDRGVTFWHLMVTMALGRRVNHGAAGSAGAEAGRAAPRTAFGGRGVTHFIHCLPASAGHFTRA